MNNKNSDKIISNKSTTTTSQGGRGSHLGRHVYPLHIESFRHEARNYPSGTPILGAQHMNSAYSKTIARI
jgi:hypothetical protein